VGGCGHTFCEVGRPTILIPQGERKKKTARRGIFCRKSPGKKRGKQRFNMDYSHVRAGRVDTKMKLEMAEPEGTKRRLRRRIPGQGGGR